MRIAGGHTVKSYSPASLCYAIPKINRLCTLKLNTDVMILWQMVMSMAKDTTVAKTFSILPPNALMGETENNNPAASAASSLSEITDIRS